MPKLFLQEVTKQTLPSFIQHHSVLFPVVYADPFYDNFITDSNYSGFFVIMGDYPIGVVSYKTASTNIGYIMTFGILANWRSMGFGRATLSMTEDIMISMNVSCVYLHVHVGNINGIEFYMRNGYSIKKCEQNYYKTILPPKAYMLEKILY